MKGWLNWLARGWRLQLILSVALLTSLCVFLQNVQPRRTMWVANKECSNCILHRPLHYHQLQPNLLLVLIHSRASGRFTRDVIRKTWLLAIQGGNDAFPNPPMQYRFVVGGFNLSSSLFDDEQKEHNDLLILPDVTDSAASLTDRTLSSLKIAHAKFNFTYILKCDDDSFGDLLRIATDLHFRTSKGRLYWGQMAGYNYPIEYGPWAEKQGAWSVCDFFLPYAYGGGYVLSSDLVELILRNSDVLKVYSNEDATIGAWLAPYNIERVHDIRFNTEGFSRGCKDPFIFMHKVSPVEMIELYRSLSTKGRLCTEATFKEGFPGYVYNWTQKPSLCCTRNSMYNDVP